MPFAGFFAALAGFLVAGFAVAGFVAVDAAFGFEGGGAALAPAAPKTKKQSRANTPLPH